MLHNVMYDKVKILCTLSQLCWFIEKHAKGDAQKAGNAQDVETLSKIEQDLHRHIEELQKSLCG